MVQWLCVAVAAVAVVSSVLGDLPVECYFDDVVGQWSFHETARDGDNTLACQELGEVKFEKKIQLRFPNTAEDEFGNIGTWTMVYDQGFEVVVGGRSYFAFNYFVKNGTTTTSFCGQTFVGWARDLTVRNWSCFRADKTTSVAPRVTDTPLTEHLLPYWQDERFVDAINRHQHRWTAVTYPQFQGLTLAQVFKMRGGQKVRRAHGRVRNHRASLKTRLRAQMLPKHFDWRNVSDINYVRPVKNQGTCGSCYAFASIAVLESQLLIHSDATEQLDLSAEDVVSCSRLSQGCEGGFPYLIAGRYAQDVGLVSVQCTPYDHLNQTCDQHKRSGCRHIYTTDYNYVGGYFGACNEEEMLLAVVEGGPVAVGIEVAEDFMSYKSGIYHKTGLSDAFNPLEETNHAVLVVGYGESPAGEKYWIVQNSWGTGWGMDGYFLIRRGTDEIAIESLAVQVVAYP